MVLQKSRTTISSAEVEDVAKKLRKDIFSGIRLPRERLVENKIAETFSISRMVVRQVLSQLEREGLIVIEPFKGASVADISIKTIAENYQIIGMLEGYAAKLAAKKLTKEELEKLKKIHQALEKIGTDRVREWHELNSKFHRIIILKCGNEKLIELIFQHSQFTSFWFLVLSAPGRIPKNNEEHGLVLDALMKHDEKLSQRLMERHIVDAGEYLVKSIRETLPMGVWRGRL